MKEGQKNFRNAASFYNTQKIRVRKSNLAPSDDPFRADPAPCLAAEEYNRIARDNFRHAKLQYEDMLDRNC